MATAGRTIMSGVAAPARFTNALEPCQRPSRGTESTVVKPRLRCGSGWVGGVILSAAETSAKTPAGVGEIYRSGALISSGTGTAVRPVVAGGGTGTGGGKPKKVEASIQPAQTVSPLASKISASGGMATFSPAA